VTLIAGQEGQDGAVATIRPMVPGDAVAAEEVWHQAFSAMWAATSMGELPEDPDRRARVVERAARLAGTLAGPEERAYHVRRIAAVADSDPRGSWVAEVDGTVVGLAQALVRDGLWVLSLLGVTPHLQSAGVGRELLARALAYGDDAGAGLILSSRDARAQRLYQDAGFELCPTVSAKGVVRRGGLPAVDSSVREGDSDDLAVVAAIDRRIRGSAHGPELALLLQLDHQLVLAGERGYALVSNKGVSVVAADDVHTATALLVQGLARVPDGREAEVLWLTHEQQWAIQCCEDLGLRLSEGGAVMRRGRLGPMHPYVPSGAFG
jgi:GNAT superfamily N-acetyltransferase